ncbi:hypothetical protein Q9966_013637 [Columba livia]|nr:hypothetical protein Q9966_013637 [Columba livia]
MLRRFIESCGQQLTCFSIRIMRKGVLGRGDVRAEQHRGWLCAAAIEHP